MVNLEDYDSEYEKYKKDFKKEKSKLKKNRQKWEKIVTINDTYLVKYLDQFIGKRLNQIFPKKMPYTKYPKQALEEFA